MMTNFRFWSWAWPQRSCFSFQRFGRGTQRAFPALQFAYRYQDVGFGCQAVGFALQSLTRGQLVVQVFDGNRKFVVHPSVGISPPLN